MCHNDPFKQGILDDLREVSTDVRTYELLAEVFIEYTIKEMEDGPPGPERITRLRELYFDVFRLFEIARAAKELGEE